MRYLLSRRGKIGIVFGTLFAILVLLFVLGSLIQLHPRYAAEHILAFKYNRPVSIGALRIVRGDWIKIELEDVHFGNAGWGTEPDMVTIGNLSAELDFASLFYGRLRFRNALIDGLSIFLERNGDGVGNWHFGNSRRSTKTAEEAARESRESLPDVFGLVLRNSRFRMRTSGGGLLTIDISDLNLHTTAEDQPGTMAVKGKYNGVPVHLDIATQSLAALHDIHRPFGIDVSGTAATTAIKFTGDMTDPLNFEGAHGKLHAEIQNIGEAASLFGSPFHGDVPVKFDGLLQRNGDVWDFTSVEGDCGGNSFSNSHLTLTEGERLKPDNVRAALNFSAFDLVPLTAGLKTGREMYLTSLNKNLGVNIDADVTAKTITSGDLKFDNVKLHASVTSGAAAIDKYSTQVFGGEMEGSAAAKATNFGNTISINTAIHSGDASQLLQVFGVDKRLLSGRFDLALNVAANGGTAQDLKTTGRGDMVFSMNKGEASQQAIQLASLDWKALFHKASVPTSMNCLLAVMKFNNGVGALSPFRLETDDGTLIGMGQVDLAQNKLDLSFQTDKNTTSPSALDKPIHITGDMDNPDITPLVFSEKNMAHNQTQKPTLPVAEQSIADRNVCNRQ